MSSPSHAAASSDSCACGVATVCNCHLQATEREQGCTCADEIVAMNNRGDYVGHESSCPRHWQLVDETSAWEDDDDA